VVQQNQAIRIQRNASLYTPKTPFEVGDLVNMFTILPVKNKSKKATSQWVGPYRVSKLINPNTVEITSLNLLKRFAVNITVLQVYRGNDRGRPHPVEAHHLVPDEQDPEQVPVGVPGPDDDLDNENDDDEDDTSPLVQSHPVPERMVQLVPPLGARPVSPTPPPLVLNLDPPSPWTHLSWVSLKSSRSLR